MATQYHPRSRQPSETTLRAEALLTRYPDLSTQELADLIAILPSLPMLDRALMTADEQLSEKLTALYRDHGSKIRAPVAALTWFLAFPLIVTSGALWWLLA